MKSPDQIIADTFIFIVVLIAVAAIGFICYVICDRIRNAKAPTRKVRAQVVLKKQDKHSVDIGSGSRLSRYADLAPLLGNKESDVTIYQSWDYYATFAFEGRMEEFHVPESIYTDLSEGDDGILIYKGDRVEFFMHTEKTPPAGKFNS